MAENRPNHKTPTPAVAKPVSGNRCPGSGCARYGGVVWVVVVVVAGGATIGIGAGVVVVLSVVVVLAGAAGVGL
jgi:hypothetical protein